MHRYRSHTCGQLRDTDAGAKTRLSGWCHRIRDHGGVLFIDLRDHYGMTQCVVDPDSPAFKLAETLAKAKASDAVLFMLTTSLSQDVPLELRTYQNDLTGVTLEYSADGFSWTPLAMAWDRDLAACGETPELPFTCVLWKGIIPGAAAASWYRFQAVDNLASAWVGKADTGTSSKVASSSTMVVPFDSSVNVAFPHIVRAFELPIQAIQWVVIAYTLTYAALTLVCGRIGDMIGHRRVFLAGCACSADAPPAVCAIACGMAARDTASSARSPSRARITPCIGSSPAGRRANRNPRRPAASSPCPCPPASGASGLLQRCPPQAGAGPCSLAAGCARSAAACPRT